MKQFIIALVLVAVVGGCKTTTTLRSVDDSAQVIVVNAPDDAKLYIDGSLMGNASDYRKAKNALMVESGTHLIEVKSGTQTLYTGKQFLGPSMLVTVNASTGSGN